MFLKSATGGVEFKRSYQMTNLLGKLVPSLVDNIFGQFVHEITISFMPSPIRGQIKIHKIVEKDRVAVYRKKNKINFLRRTKSSCCVFIYLFIHYSIHPLFIYPPVTTMTLNFKKDNSLYENNGEAHAAPWSCRPNFLMQTLYAEGIILTGHGISSDDLWIRRPTNL